MLLLYLPHIIRSIIGVSVLLNLLHLHDLLLDLNLLSGLVLTHGNWAIIVCLKVHWLLIDGISKLSYNSWTFSVFSLRSWLLLLKLRVGSIGELDLENLIVDVLHHLWVCANDGNLPIMTSWLCSYHLLLHVGRVLLGLVSSRAVWSKLRVSAASCSSLVCIMVEGTRLWCLWDLPFEGTSLASRTRLSYARVHLLLVHLLEGLITHKHALSVHKLVSFLPADIIVTL